MPEGFRPRTFPLRSIFGPPKEKRGSATRALTLPQPPLLGAHHIAEASPGLAVEARQLHLLDRREVGRARVDLDARQRGVGDEVLEAGRLLHDVGAAQVVARLLEHLLERL